MKLEKKHKKPKTVFLVCKPGEYLFPSNEWDRKPAKALQAIQRVLVK